jgi:putative transcriptional regulator
MKGKRQAARVAALCLAFLAAGAGAQQAERPNAVLLIAKPDLVDPNFSRSVVLVTQTESGDTVGVILNRPSEQKHPRTGEVLFSGGPVMREVPLALFRSAEPPAAPAFHVLRDIYLTMHPENIDKLLSGEKRDYRLYSGFSGWAPGQLESEIQRDGWYVLPASEAVLFRADPAGLWEELMERVRGERADPRIIPRYALSKISSHASGSDQRRIHF